MIQEEDQLQFIHKPKKIRVKEVMENTNTKAPEEEQAPEEDEKEPEEERGPLAIYSFIFTKFC